MGWLKRKLKHPEITVSEEDGGLGLAVNQAGGHGDGEAAGGEGNRRGLALFVAGRNALQLIGLWLGPEPRALFAEHPQRQVGEAVLAQGIVAGWWFCHGGHVTDNTRRSPASTAREYPPR